MGKNLPVVYKSQWDDDASKSNNDCGPASIAMILDFFGKTITTNEINEMIQDGGLVTFQQLTDVIDKLGFGFELKRDCKFEDIVTSINNGVPVMPLVHYGSLNSTQDKVFKGGHFMVVVGYLENGDLLVNDPNFKDNLRQDGDHHIYTKQEFMKAWGECNLDGNMNYQMLIIKDPDIDEEKPTAPEVPSYILHPHELTLTVAVNKLRVRTTPTINTNNIVAKRTLAINKKFTAEGFVEGDDVSGNNLWWKFKGEDLYVWSGGTNAVPELPKEEAKPVVEEKPVEVIDYKTLCDSKDKEILLLRGDMLRIHEITKNWLNTEEQGGVVVKKEKTSGLNWLTGLFSLKN